MSAAYKESEDFAEDFREALDDLQVNNRFDIQNLTMIARENTEHALVISKALQDHIKKAAPHKKLPSLYVLDSIVKNVGTPYTLFFGKRLYETYMDAYASVDMPTRRKMDEMLKTWKEPIPGSIDTRPVFPPDITRPIENALIKARTSAMQAQQHQFRAEQQVLHRGRSAAAPPAPGTPFRETPTPPMTRPPSTPGLIRGTPSQATSNGMFGPPQNSHQGQYPSQQNQQTPTASMTHAATPNPHFQPPHPAGYSTSRPGISTEGLKKDIRELVSAFQAEFSRNPNDSSIQTRLVALVDLQRILQSQDLPQEQLVLIKNQIAQLAVTIRTAPPVAIPPVAVPPVPTPQPSVAVSSLPAASAPMPRKAPVSIDSLLGSGTLAALLSRGAATPPIPTPPPPPATVAIRSPQTKTVKLPERPADSSTPDPLSILDILRKSGVLRPTTSAVNAAHTAHATPTAPIPQPQGSTSVQAPVRSSIIVPLPPPIPPNGSPTVEHLTHDIELNESSIKQFRPHLVPLLFDNLGPRCTQCGRRFKTDEEGKKEKMAHMDWHFKVNQRIAESEKKGQHRSWFVDEMDWVNTREVVDTDYVPPNINDSNDGDAAGRNGIGLGISGNNTGSGNNNRAPKQWIPVPDDPSQANAMCPICQEKFDTLWLDDAQEFVWLDALRVGERVYHASCHKEAIGNSSIGAAASMTAATTGPYGLPSSVGSRATPEPVLGKRKAAVSSLGGLSTIIPIQDTMEALRIMGNGVLTMLKQDEMASLRGKMRLETA